MQTQAKSHRRLTTDITHSQFRRCQTERLEARTLLSGWTTVDGPPSSNNWYNTINGMAADNAGNIYAAGADNGSALVHEKLAGGSAFQTVSATLPTLAGATSTHSEFYSVGTDAAGNAYLSGYVKSYNSSGSFLGQTPFILKSAVGQNSFAPVPINFNVPSGDKLSFVIGQVIAADSAGDVYVLGSLAVPTGTTGHGTSQQTTYTNHGVLFEMPAGQSSFSAVYQSTTFNPSSITIINSGPSAGIYIASYNGWSVSKSTDGGATWTTVGSFVYDPNLPAYNTTSYAIASDSTGNGNVYVTGYGSQRVLTGYTTSKGKTTPVYAYYGHWITRQSRDGGATWTTVDDYEPSLTGDNQAYAIADVSGTLYVAGIGTAGPDGIVRTNANGTWQTADDDANDYYGSVVIDPTTMTAYAGFSDGIWGIRSSGAPAAPAAPALAPATFSTTTIAGNSVQPNSQTGAITPEFSTSTDGSTLTDQLFDKPAKKAHAHGH